MKQKIIGWFLLLICLVLTFSFVRAWRRWIDRHSILADAYRKLGEAKRTNDVLTRELAKSQTPEFVEKQAREKLNMAKEGEVVVILPPITPIVSPTPTPPDTRANWEKWIGVFF